MKSLPPSNYSLSISQPRGPVLQNTWSPKRKGGILQSFSSCTHRFLPLWSWNFQDQSQQYTSQEDKDEPPMSSAFFLFFLSIWAESQWWDFQAILPTYIHPWTPSSIWRIKFRRKLRQRYIPKGINGTETGWWYLSTFWRHSWYRWNNHHFQVKLA